MVLLLVLETMRELSDYFSTSFYDALSLSSYNKLFFDVCSHRAVYYFMSAVNWP